MPQAGAASLGDDPSSTNANANMRRAAEASREREAACRKVGAVWSVRVIETAAISSPQTHSENRMTAPVVEGISRERSNRAVGITPLRRPIVPTHTNVGL